MLSLNISRIHIGGFAAHVGAGTRNDGLVGVAAIVGAASAGGTCREIVIALVKAFR